MQQAPSLDFVRDDAAAKARFESFKLGKGLPSTINQKHAHARSHSRNTSISSSLSSFSLSVSKPVVPADVCVPSTVTTPAAANAAPSSKRNSHHRRRSSVSTRHESAEMMGLSLPDLPPSASDDNINLGEKDSIRRRALWALEGKPDMSFSKVEIPELSTPLMEKMMFDFCENSCMEFTDVLFTEEPSLATKASLPSSSSANFVASHNGLMANKRDSFKLLGPSSSSKDQLHTLMEEEEEEEDSPKTPEANPAPVLENHAAPLPSASMKPVVSRPRPATLILRPLSLTPDNLISATSGLPTPSATPSPRVGLKSLALAPSAMEDSAGTKSAKRFSWSFKSSQRQPSNNCSDATPPTPASEEDEKPVRRSSISYKTSSGNGAVVGISGLPTPEMTPTFLDRRYSSSSVRSMSEDEFFLKHSTQTRPLSASEHHFLLKSHNALLARITDLERALSMQRRTSGGFSAGGSSRPVSMTSEVSSTSDSGSNGPSDEMLRLISDLKAERDELKRDVDGWRTRVGDMEKQLGLVTKRVETERRDAWVARSMVGLLQVEKGNLERQVETAEKTKSALEEEKKGVERENDDLKQRFKALEEELENVKQELAEEKAKSKIEPELDVQATPTPSRASDLISRKGLRFTSFDSESCSTVVDDEDAPKFRFSLKSVLEEPDHEGNEEMSEEEDNGLLGYEDAEDSDASFQSSSSFSSNDDRQRSVTLLKGGLPRSRSASITAAIETSSASPLLHSGHSSRASLSKTWTFPRGPQTLQQNAESEIEVDRFFGCLQDLDGESTGGSTPASPSTYTYERSKGLFASGFKFDSEDVNPFVLPGGVGTVVEDERKSLEVVPEGDEDEPEAEDSLDEDMFGEAGGITITFTPPDATESIEFKRSPSPTESEAPVAALPDTTKEKPQLPEDSQSSQPLAASENVCTPPRFVMITPPSSIPRPAPARAWSPSSVPRVSPLTRQMKVATDSATVTPTKSVAALVAGRASDAYMTPPTKRGGIMPSLIPQHVSSPSPIRNSVASKQKPVNSMFMRQPQRKPLTVANGYNKPQSPVSFSSYGSTSKPQPSGLLNSTMNDGSIRRSADASAAPCTGASTEVRTFQENATLVRNTLTSAHAQRKYPFTGQDLHISDTSTRKAQEPAKSSFPISSIIASPIRSRLSFQKLTSFMPFSWTSQASTAPTSSLDSDEDIGNADLSQASIESVKYATPRRFVSRQKQLERLVNELELERSTKARPCLHLHCKNCIRDVVVV